MQRCAQRMLVLFLGLLFLLPCCGSMQKQPKDPMREAKDGAFKGFEQVSQKARSSHACIIGIRPDAGNVIMTVGSRAKGCGILPGDKIVAVDGASTPYWAQAKAKIRQRQVGETVALRVLRNGSQFDLQCPCSDVGEALLMVADALYEGYEGNWLECVAKIDRVQQEFGPSSLAQNVLLDCYGYYLRSEQKDPDNTYARAVQQMTLLKIEDVAHSKEALEVIKPWLQSQTEWLRSSNQPQLADEVDRSYQRALQRF